MLTTLNNTREIFAVKDAVLLEKGFLWEGQLPSLAICTKGAFVSRFDKKCETHLHRSGDLGGQRRGRERGFGSTCFDERWETTLPRRV